MRVTRRLFAALLIILPAAFLIRFLVPKGVNAGMLAVPLSDLPPSGAYLIRDKKIAIIQNGGRITVLSIACTHLGCTLNVNGNKLVCPCHGSQFTLEGKVTTGPATKDLLKLKFELIDGTIMV